jgi:hypothetical protein
MKASAAAVKESMLAIAAICQAREMYYRLRYFISGYPRLYMPLVRYQHRYKLDRVVTPDTDLVIEAFGRTGTTFANYAFLAAQTRRVRTVHHTHAAAQVITAVKMKIPTLVIVRDPLDVSLSHMVRHRVSARAALTAWIRFHIRILAVREGIVLCSFQQMITNFTPVIERINQKFDAGFELWRHTNENEAAIFDFIATRNRGRFSENKDLERLRALALPTPWRETQKEHLRTQLEARSLAPLRQKAQKLFGLLLQIAEGLESGEIETTGHARG